MKKTPAGLVIFLSLCTAILCFPAILPAATIHVGPSEAYKTIQAGINVAVDGDQVVVADGTYRGAGNTNIRLNGKAITVRSLNGSGACVIDCSTSQPTPRAFIVTAAAGYTTISGFHIRGAITWTDPGGAIYAESCTLTIDQCTFAVNSAPSGGAVYAFHATTYMTGCTFDTNDTKYTGTGQGGAVYIEGGYSYLSGCYFVGNNGPSAGGAVYLDGAQAHFYLCTFGDSHDPESGNQSSYGGAIYSLNSFGTASRCTFQYNAASWGAGIYSKGAPALTFDDCDFNENGGADCESGGGLFLWASPATISLCRIESNFSRQSGAGIHMENSAAQISDCRIRSNSYPSGMPGIKGAGIYASGPAFPTISKIESMLDMEITENNAGTDINAMGGGIYLENCPAKLTGCIITANNAYGGAGIYANDNGPTLENCEISLNTSPSNGFESAAFYYTSSQSAETYTNPGPTLTGCRIHNNFQGGVKLYRGNEALIKNCVISENQQGSAVSCFSPAVITNCVLAKNTGEGAVFVSEESSFIQCTFAQNRTDYTYGAAISAMARIHMINCIEWDNGNIPINDNGYNELLDISFSLITPISGYTGFNNIYGAPQFIDPANSNYRLQSSSPCIDAGATWDTSEPDIEGMVRPVNAKGHGAVPDMGAYEYGPLFVSPNDKWTASIQEDVALLDPPARTYNLKNRSQTSSQVWSVSTPGWLTPDITSGELPALSSQPVTIQVNEAAKRLAPGVQPADILFTSTRGGVVVVPLKLELTVGPVGHLKMDEEGLELQATGPLGGPFPDSVTCTLRNNGHDTLDWMAADVPVWVKVEPSSGSLLEGESVSVTVSFNEEANNRPLGIHTGEVSFEVTSVGLGSARIPVRLEVMKQTSAISCSLSTSDLILGERFIIIGKIDPKPLEAGRGVSLVLTPPSGAPILRSATADAEGSFTYPPLLYSTCADITRAGAWTVKAAWAGDADYLGAESAPQALAVVKAKSSVSVDAGSRVVKLEEPVDLSGKLSVVPDCGRDLTGFGVDLYLTGPDTFKPEDAQVVDPFGHYVLLRYAGLDELGQWSVNAVFPGGDAYQSSFSDPITIQVVETAGYAIIVEGKIDSEEGLASHNKTANFVYRQLKSRGLLDEDIFYLNYDTVQQGVTDVIVDGVPSRQAVQNAITTWAANKMNAKPSNLYIVLVDHGTQDTFYIDPEVITAADLGGWLNTLRNELHGQAGVQEIVLLLGFCQAGSFLDNIKGAYRIAIASAAEGESSYKGPLDPTDPTGVRDGEFFITEFFRAASVGKNLLRCFQEASAKTKAFTSTGTGQPNGPYPDDSKQHPLLDDNADGVGSADPTGEASTEGKLSKGAFVGVSSVTGNAPGDVQVTDTSGTLYLSAGQTTASFWAKPSDPSHMKSLWLEVKPPNYIPPDKGSEQVEMDLARYSYGGFNPAQNRYEWSNISGFTTPGTYHVFFFTRDDRTGNESALKEAIVYKAKDTNHAPGPFHLLVPQDGAAPGTALVCMWGISVDPDKDPVTYTVEISTDATFTTIDHRAERINETNYAVAASAGLKDVTTYYWRVLAVDPFGASTPSSEAFSFTTDNGPNIDLGFIVGRISDAKSNGPIPNASVRALAADPITDLRVYALSSGDYLQSLHKGVYALSAQAPQHDDKSLAGVEVQTGVKTRRDIAMDPPATRSAPAWLLLLLGD